MSNGKPFLLPICIILTLVGIIYLLRSKTSIVKHLKPLTCPICKDNGFENTEENGGGSEKQKELYQHQQEQRQAVLENDKVLAHIFNGYIPEVNCPYMARLGHPDDGGKWTCNPWKLPENCIIYSLGVGGDTSFENDINFVTQSKCHICAIDPNGAYGKLFDNFKNVQFKAWKIGETNKAMNVYSIADLMKEFNHSNIDFLKIDVEGSEFTVIPQMLHQGLRPCQMFIEIHAGHDAVKMATLLKEISKGGYLNFAKEINGYHTNLCEFSFIHEKCLKNYGIFVITHRNFKP